MSRSVIEPAGRRLFSQSRMEGVQPFRRSSRDFDSLKSEQTRLETFSLQPPWPVGFISPQSCAKAGFFYLQDGDKLQCAFCRGIAGEWEEGDNPVVEHRRHFPKCPFICHLPVGNIPLHSERGEDHEQEEDMGNDDDDEEETNSSQESRSSDVCGPFLDFATSLSIQFNRSRPSERIVSDQEIRDLIDTPTVQAALEMGIELCKVKTALQRKIQQTGTPFCSTGALLDAVLRTRDPEYESDPDSEHEDEEWRHLSQRRPPQHYPFNFNSLNLNDHTTTATQFGPGEDCAGSGSTSSSSPGQSPVSTMARNLTSRSSSGDSGQGDDEDVEQVKLQEKPPKGCDTGLDKIVKNGIEGKEEELRQLREVTQCKICMDNRVQVVFLPCGHLVSCTRCATALSNCAVCREPIKAYVKTYLS